MLFIYNVAVIVLIFFTDKVSLVVDYCDNATGMDLHGFTYYVIGFFLASILDAIFYR